MYSRNCLREMNPSLKERSSQRLLTIGPSGDPRPVPEVGSLAFGDQADSEEIIQMLAPADVISQRGRARCCLSCLKALYHLYKETQLHAYIRHVIT